ncbi:MAG: acyl carrier protein [Actinobacteria bacterium]|nr:acyl carrier protein [Actinomycetota bacterium]
MSNIRDQVHAAIYQAISATMNRPAEELTDSTELIADLGAKSVNLVRIIGALEDEFDLEIPFMEFRRKKSIGEAIDYVVRLYEA